jgi:hypothetical protein
VKELRVQSIYFEYRSFSRLTKFLAVNRMADDIR